jgi:glycosyltransferase involved in cell wall biosynthesis
VSQGRAAREIEAMPPPGGLSIAILSRNQELFLPRLLVPALEAVALLRAEGFDGEVLVIDDHSRDGSLTLLRNLEALHFADGLRVLALATHAGRAISRNQGLWNARFPYITFLDTNNELLAENITLFLRTLQQTGAAAVYGNLLVRSVTSHCAHNILSNESMQPKLFQRNYVDGFALFDRRQLLDCAGFTANERLREDHELWMHLVASGRRIVFVPVVLGYYYLLPSSIGAADDLFSKDRQPGDARVFDEPRLRASLPANTYHLRHHPQIGYV